MFKSFKPPIWAFDAEFVPDPDVGRQMWPELRQGDDSEQETDKEVVDIMFQNNRNYHAVDNPRPYLKTPLCRLVSVSIVARAADGKLTLFSIPGPGKESNEEEIVSRFLTGVEKTQPQLVGWNSRGADWWIFVQRAMRYGMTFPKLARPDKPWNGNDYYDKNSDIHVDLKDCTSAFGRDTASLNEMAACLGVPGKIGVSGGDVLDLWQAGKVDEIVQYNEHDAITTYLVWLRAALFGGFISAAEFRDSETLVEDLLLQSKKPHLEAYLREWGR